MSVRHHIDEVKIWGTPQAIPQPEAPTELATELTILIAAAPIK
jgi:hypothetical protein